MILKQNAQTGKRLIKYRTNETPNRLPMEMHFYFLSRGVVGLNAFNEKKKIRVNGRTVLNLSHLQRRMVIPGWAISRLPPPPNFTVDTFLVTWDPSHLNSR